MPKAAEFGSTPTQERRATGGLSVVMLEHRRTMKKNVNYFDAACEGGVAGLAREFSLFVI